MPKRLLTATALFVGSAYAQPPAQLTPTALSPVLDGCRVSGNIVVHESQGKSLRSEICSFEMAGVTRELPLGFTTQEGGSCAAVGEKVEERGLDACRFVDEDQEILVYLPAQKGV